MALPAAAFAEEAYTTTAVNLRAGPDADYPLVRWVPEGTAVDVHGCLADYRWCDVEVYGDRGWMSASYLVYPYQSSNVPIVTYGPVIGLPLIGFSFESYWDNHYHSRPWYGDRHRWAHRYRPEYSAPRYRPPPQHRPPQYYPPAARPEYRPPLVRPSPQPYYRGREEYGGRPQPDYRSPAPSPSYRSPPPVRQPGPLPSARPSGPPAQQPSARPSAPPRPSTQGPTVRGRDPQGLRDNSGERGGMNTGNY
jgi:uncharacterized protein YraI